MYSRTLAAEVEHDGAVLAAAGTDVGDVLIDALVAPGVEPIKVRSVLTCESKVGTCARCYGRSLATGKPSTSARRSASSPPSRSVSRDAAHHAHLPHRWCGDGRR